MVRSRLDALAALEPGVVNGLFADMRAEAEAVVRLGAPEGALVETRAAFMRYRGQGHEIAVELPHRAFTSDDGAQIRDVVRSANTRLCSGASSRGSRSRR